VVDLKTFPRYFRFAFSCRAACSQSPGFAIGHCFEAALWHWRHRRDAWLQRQHDCKNSSWMHEQILFFENSLSIRRRRILTLIDSTSGSWFRAAPDRWISAFVEFWFGTDRGDLGVDLDLKRVKK